MYIYPIPTLQAGCNTKSIFKPTWTDCLTKGKEPNLPYYCS